MYEVGASFVVLHTDKSSSKHLLKGYSFSIELSWHPCQNQIFQCRGLFLDSVLIPVLYCLIYSCNFVVSLEIMKCVCFSFVCYFLKTILFWSLPFTIWILGSAFLYFPLLSSFYKEASWDFERVNLPVLLILLVLTVQNNCYFDLYFLIVWGTYLFKNIFIFLLCCCRYIPLVLTFKYRSVCILIKKEIHDLIFSRIFLMLRNNKQLHFIEVYSVVFKFFLLKVNRRWPSWCTIKRLFCWILFLLFNFQ